MDSLVSTKTLSSGDDSYPCKGGGIGTDDPNSPYILYWGDNDYDQNRDPLNLPQRFDDLLLPVLEVAQGV